MKNFEPRPLGVHEKVFWILDQKANLHFAIAAEIDGQAPIADWRNALNMVQQRHPNLSAFITGNQYSNAKIQHVGCCPIPMRVVKQAAGANWNAELEKEMDTPFNLHVAPLVRTILIEQPGKSIFIFVSNHTIADGMSIALVIRDVLTVLEGNVLNNLNAIPSIDEILSVPVKPVAPNKDFDAISQAPIGPRPPVSINRLQLSAQATQKLIAASKLHNTSVHGALTAACIFAGRQLSKKWQENTVRILHPISLRKALQLGDDYGLLFNSVIESYNPTPDVLFWDLAHTAKQGIDTVKTLEYTKGMLESTSEIFYQGIDLDTIYDVLGQAFEHDLLLTNLTQIPYDTNFGSLTLKALWGPVVIAPMPGAQTLGVSTVDGSMTLTLTSHTPLKGFLEAVENIIIGACHKGESLVIC